MIFYEVTREFYKECQDFCDSAQMDYGGEVSANKEMQIAGVIGENLIRKMMGKPPITDLQGGDGGCDFTKPDWTGNEIRVDIKTMARSVPVRREFVNNLAGKQLNNKVDGYIFCSFNRTAMELEICGWIEKWRALQIGNFTTAGEARLRADGTLLSVRGNNMVEIPMRALYNHVRMNNLIQDIITKISIQRAR